jgi:uncharacterized protein YcsI (UPF0317 family)
MLKTAEQTKVDIRRLDFAFATGAAVRELCRTGWSDRTTGMARGYYQANLAIVPERYAFDFMLFCQRNPKPCPILEVLDPGDPEIKTVALGADVRTDLPRYRIYRDGKLAGEFTDIRKHYRKDHVAFLLGCSFSVDLLLHQLGVEVPYFDGETGILGAYATSIQCAKAGVFSGPQVAFLRIIPKSVLIPVIETTSRYPLAHGGPIHVGDPREIGIKDISRPSYGEYRPPNEEEVHAFWSCGVTPQAVAMAAGLPELISHAPAHMFVTDMKLGGPATGPFC